VLRGRTPDHASSGRAGGGSGGLGFFDSIADGVMVGGFGALGIEGVGDLVADLGPDDDPSEGAEGCDPAVAEQPGKHGHVDWAVGFRRGEGFVLPWVGGEIGEEGGEWRREGERGRPRSAGGG
jgi:hypothetical protein